MKTAPKYASRSTSPFEAYHRDVMDKGMLTKDDEVRLGKLLEEGGDRLLQARARLSSGKSVSRKATSGERTARSQVRRWEKEREKHRAAFIEGNLRLVVYLAAKHRRFGPQFLDLVQEGNLGLMKAVENYDYRRGCKFATYAMWWIRLHMDRFLRSDRTVKGPSRQRPLRAPEPDHASGFDPEKTEGVARSARPPAMMPLVLPLDNKESGKKSLAETLQDASTPSPLDSYMKNNLSSRIHEALVVLDPRERKVIELYFGLGDGDERSLSKIGACLGVSQQRVYQLKARALGKLQTRKNTLFLA